MPIRIRHMHEKDAEAVAGLLHESWDLTHGPLMGAELARKTSADWHAPEKLAKEAADPDIIAFVAQDGAGDIVGYAMAGMDAGRRAWLRRFYVAPGHFGSGLAADLMHAVLAAHVGLPAIDLEVAVGNDRAIAFYRKQGFVELARQDHCGHLPGVPSLVMRRLLPRA